ncbi:hypothetical protein NDU88_001700 [Pleurodeles waltl]|uniref:Uncharacterized protein n=1 Tax=Pleurodeles waltl TaxID=8319 RepID=A0AAV7TIK1_PLEWA|nr:hypothetical protein NDU88_001700 [Pleurodeles waltl]
MASPHNIEVQRTGGGPPPTPPEYSSLEEKVLAILHPEGLTRPSGGMDLEGVPVVESAGDEGLGDGFPRVRGNPFEDPAEHLQGVEAGHGDGVDLPGHGEGGVEDDPQVASVVCGVRGCV